MKSKQITLEIQISVFDGKMMPEGQLILDKVIDHLYDFQIEDSAIIDRVLITGIDGISTEDLD